VRDRGSITAFDTIFTSMWCYFSVAAPSNACVRAACPVFEQGRADQHSWWSLRLFAERRDHREPSGAGILEEERQVGSIDIAY